MSARAVAIGLLCVAGLCAAVPYNDYRLQNTFLYGNHLPVAGIFLLMLLTLGVNALLRRQWVDNEKLTFPLVQLPLAMIEAPEPGRRVNAFYRSPSMWAGFALVSLIHTTNGLHTYYASFPELPLRIDMRPAFPDRPW